MRPFLAIFFCLFLIGCNTPSPGFKGLEPTRITVDGSTFEVRVKPGFAEAIRVNTQYAPRFGLIEQRAKMAMSEVSGCRVKAIKGDQALATGVLDCGDGGPEIPTEPLEISCYSVRGSELVVGDEIYVDLDCSG